MITIKSFNNSNTLLNSSMFRKGEKISDITSEDYEFWY